METTIFNIKASCVRANPPHGWEDYDLREASDFVAARTVRLADVLLAMKSVCLEVRWFEGSDAFMSLDGDNALWNLREDDLEKQSPETIEFLANVLGV